MNLICTNWCGINSLVEWKYKLIKTNHVDQVIFHSINELMTHQFVQNIVQKFIAVSLLLILTYNNNNNLFLINYNNNNINKGQIAPLDVSFSPLCFCLSSQTQRERESERDARVSDSDGCVFSSSLHFTLVINRFACPLCGPSQRSLLCSFFLFIRRQRLLGMSATKIINSTYLLGFGFV